MSRNLYYFKLNVVEDTKTITHDNTIDYKVISINGNPKINFSLRVQSQIFVSILHCSWRVSNIVEKLIKLQSVHLFVCIHASVCVSYEVVLFYTSHLSMHEWNTVSFECHQTCSTPGTEQMITSPRAASVFRPKKSLKYNCNKKRSMS